MSNLVENRIYSPAKFWAGEFPVVTESGKAAAAISQYDLIMSDGSGGLVKATNEALPTWWALPWLPQKQRNPWCMP